MKKAIGILAGVLLVAAAAGCGGSTRATTATETGASAQATTPAETPSVTTAPSGTAGESSRLPSTSTCSTTTTSTTEGPYYVTGTAALTDGNLNAGKLPGDPIRIAGDRKSVV